MKALIQIKLKEFSTPNFVLEDVGSAARQFPLSDLDPDTLAAMCEEFTREIFEKAGKPRPPISGV